MIKILNLYSGIGGNRKLWEDVKVTAIEDIHEIAEEYRRNYPSDEVIEGDAIEYFLEHHHEFDFIWASPVCKTHSNMNYVINARGTRRIPDLNTLYGLIIYCQKFVKVPWVVENVKPYYDALINPTFILGRHYYWSNFPVIGTGFKFSDFSITGMMNDRTRKKMKETKYSWLEMASPNELQDYLQIKLSDNFEGDKRQALRNVVKPKDGLIILQSAFNQKPLNEWFGETKDGI